MTLPPVIHSRGSLVRGAQQRQLALPRAQLVLDAVQVGALYKSRWQVELFFKWIKQNLRIKTNDCNYQKTTQDAPRYTRSCKSRA
jgi:hypothetical protein